MFASLLAKLKVVVRLKTFWAAVLAAVAGFLAGTLDIAGLVQAILAAIG